MSFLLALVAWYSVSGREKVDIWTEASVQFANMPENFVVRDGLLQKLNVRIRGPKGLVRDVAEKPLAYSLDLSHLKQGLNVLTIDPDSFPLAKPFEVMEISPPRVEISVDRVASRQVPVKPVWEGTLDPDYQLMNVVVQPQHVVILGPEKIVSEIQQVETQIISLPSATPGRIEEVTPLNLPHEIEADPGFVNVRLQFGVKTKGFTFELPLTVENRTDYAASLAPAKIKAEVEVPLPLVRAGEVEQAVSASVLAEEFLGPGSYPRTPRVVLPPGAKLLSLEPTYVELTLEQVEAGKDNAQGGHEQ